MDKFGTGPSGIDPETAGFLPIDKSPGPYWPSDGPWYT